MSAALLCDEVLCDLAEHVAVFHEFEEALEGDEAAALRVHEYVSPPLRVYCRVVLVQARLPLKLFINLRRTDLLF